MTRPSRQLVLDLPHRAALAAEDFLVSGANRAAADIVDRWPDWPLASLMVVAPPRAGKSHLANVWRLKSGAARLNSSRQPASIASTSRRVVGRSGAARAAWKRFTARLRSPPFR